MLLVGAGHAHLHVALQAAALRQAGIHLTLIDPGRFWYSGMAAGMITGDYTSEETTLDPQVLIQASGGTYIRSFLVNLDPKQKIVHLGNGQVEPYEFLSLNIGSEVDVLFPVSGNRVRTVKPISEVPDILQELRQQRQEGEPVKLCVVGGGPTGCEVTASLAARCRLDHIPAHITLLSSESRLLPGMPQPVSRKMETVLKKRGVHIHVDAKVERIEDRKAYLEMAAPLEADLFLLATGLRPPRIIQDLPLSRGASGGILITSTLQSVSDPCVFAAGDCSDFGPRPLPKLGVYGVRKGTILLENIVRIVQGRPLKEYRPQKRALQIIQTGKRRGLFLYKPFYFEGRGAFRIKSWIDQNFLNTYR